MYIVYSPVKHILGIWADGWPHVAIKREVRVATLGRKIASVYIESVAEYDNDWILIAEL